MRIGTVSVSMRRFCFTWNICIATCSATTTIKQGRMTIGVARKLIAFSLIHITTTINGTFDFKIYKQFSAHMDAVKYQVRGGGG
jgi:hypothetical protein